MSFWTRHQIFEKNSIVLVAGILGVIAIGGLVEITPLFYLKSTIEKVDGNTITAKLRDGSAAKAEQQLLKEVRVAPTLVKYANPNPYEIETRGALQQAAVEVIGRTQIAPSN